MIPDTHAKGLKQEDTLTKWALRAMKLAQTALAPSVIKINVHLKQWVSAYMRILTLSSGACVLKGTCLLPCPLSVYSPPPSPHVHKSDNNFINL